jgi:hypothetical protein
LRLAFENAGDAAFASGNCWQAAQPEAVEHDVEVSFRYIVPFKASPQTVFAQYILRFLLPRTAI